MWRRFLAVALLGLCLGAPAAQAEYAQAMGYTPKYPRGFSHFDYVNPDAPKGGSFILSSTGTFDSLNPFLLKGVSANGLNTLVFETLMAPSMDEPFSQYGLLADDVTEAPDGLSVTFHINPKARFSDGTPVMAADVKFSFDELKSDQAHPQYRIYWRDIKKAEVLGPRTIRFDFSRRNRELAMIAGQIPVFSRHWIGKHKFSDVTQKPPIASGPYVVASFSLGDYITYRRNPHYWARDLNTRRGMFNFNRITFKYYRDSTVALEGFKAGEFDFISVFNSKQWARDYTGPKFDSGRIRKVELPHHNDAGMQGFVFNTRRALFRDVRVRKAIALAMDFPWANRNLFYGQYKRCDSYFSNSDLAATGIPRGAELALLQPYRKELPPQLFTQPWKPATTKPPHSLRKNLIKAMHLLAEAGWHYRDGALRNAKGRPFRFEILLVQKGFERIVAPFARNLAILGIKVDYRTVDPAIYQQRVDNFNFDMIVQVFPESQSPGNELRNMFYSTAADQPGSFNTPGIKSPVVDAMVNKVIDARSRAQLVTAAHALDRVLLWGYYVVPNWYIGVHRIAYWKGFAYPKHLPLYYQATDWALMTWWKLPGVAAPKEH